MRYQISLSEVIWVPDNILPGGRTTDCMEGVARKVRGRRKAKRARLRLVGWER